MDVKVGSIRDVVIFSYSGLRLETAVLGFTETKVEFIYQSINGFQEPLPHVDVELPYLIEHTCHLQDHLTGKIKWSNLLFEPTSNNQFSSLDQRLHRNTENFLISFSVNGVILERDGSDTSPEGLDEYKNV